MGPKKTVSVIAFRIAMTLDVKILGFGHQVIMVTKTFFFCLRVWVFGGLAETRLVQFEKKPYKNYPA